MNCQVPKACRDEMETNERIACYMHLNLKLNNDSESKFLHAQRNFHTRLKFKLVFRFCHEHEPNCMAHCSVPEFMIPCLPESQCGQQTNTDHTCFIYYTNL